MAPRRKRTAAKKGRSTKAKPKLPEGKLDSSMTLEEKENKVSDYIKDFDLQVKASLGKMRKSVGTAKSIVTNAYRSVLILLPKNVKQMTMKEFMSNGGTVNTAVNAQVNECIMTGLVNEGLSLMKGSNERLPLTNVSNKVDISASHISEVTQSETTSDVKKTGKRGRPKKVRITDEKPTAGMATRSSRRIQAKSVVTPMPAINSQSILQTHFITPKFDPRLPITPAIVRDPKAGETIMSMCGSPLTNPAGPGSSVAKDPQLFIPVKGGKTMQISLSDLSKPMDLDVANDNVALQNLRLLQEQLCKLLEVPMEIGEPKQTS